MDVTPRKRTKIVTLHVHTAKTYREIASVVGVSLATVSRVINWKQETGSVSPKCKGKCGRKKKTTPRYDAYLLRQSTLQNE
ncbi:domain-containing [Podarcis lilfordi]|uniref:Domain-containing n=1 Tax=Podarcis lilfordi TaxID=74358 RepID=A0AA35LG20_9SAUR|nr:domain-containing [Podarcis lilfordi]